MADNDQKHDDTFGHKPGCLYLPGQPLHTPGTAHRVPIDCCTVDGLLREIDRLNDADASRATEIQRLKAEIYDLRRQEGR